MFLERVGILQTIQTVILAGALGLESYSFHSDKTWEKFLKRKYSAQDRLQVCGYLLEKIGSQVKNVTDTTTTGDEKQKFIRNILRHSLGEGVVIALITVCIILLLLHLGAACFSPNHKYRTTYTAITQGFTMYASGFAAILLAISAHYTDDAIEGLAKNVPNCGILAVCKLHRAETISNWKKIIDDLKKKGDISNDPGPKDVRKIIQDTDACQQFTTKIIAAYILGVAIVFSLIIICQAMDLVTVYDDADIDDAEVARRKALERHTGKKIRNLMMRGHGGVAGASFAITGPPIDHLNPQTHDQLDSKQSSIGSLHSFSSMYNVPPPQQNIAAQLAKLQRSAANTPPATKPHHP